MWYLEVKDVGLKQMVHSKTQEGYTYGTQTK